jgi:hypothetical protein
MISLAGLLLAHRDRSLRSTNSVGIGGIATCHERRGHSEATRMTRTGLDRASSKSLTARRAPGATMKKF